MADTARVLFHPVNKVVTVPNNTTVLEALRQAEIPFESICGGKGECNKCRVIFLFRLLHRRFSCEPQGSDARRGQT